jgi:transcriptional antiterminator RfaH
MTEPPGIETPRRWYVAQSQPHKELYAADNLGRLGFETFTPRLARTVRHARKTRRVLRPLFPRYLFVSLDLARDRWRSACGAFGVAALIMDGERPKPVPRGVVETFAAAADGKGGFDFSQRLVVGEEVRFVAGPFADTVGHLVEMDAAGRVAVLLEIMGAARVVSAAAVNLLPARV